MRAAKFKHDSYSFISCDIHKHTSLIGSNKSKKLGSNSVFHQLISIKHSNLDLFIDLVNECLEEVESILLFTYVHRSVSPQMKHLPEPLRNIVLQLALQQVTKNLLNLVKKAANTSNKLSLFHEQWTCITLHHIPSKCIYIIRLTNGYLKQSMVETTATNYPKSSAWLTAMPVTYIATCDRKIANLSERCTCYWWL